MHLTKLRYAPLKSIFAYLQDGYPLQLKQLHFINVFPYMDKVMSFIAPLMKKETMESVSNQKITWIFHQNSLFVLHSSISPLSVNFYVFILPLLYYDVSLCSNHGIRLGSNLAAAGIARAKRQQAW